MKAVPVALLTLGLAACGGGAGPAALAASDVAILAPIPGQDRSVAYLVLENRGDGPVTLGSISSPQFARVEMHTTTVDGGVSSMRRLDSITIPAGSRLEFSPGGRHVMLISPRAALTAGDPVTLQFHFEPPATPALLIVEAPLKARMPGGGD